MGPPLPTARKTVTKGNAVLDDVLDFAPSQFRHELESRLAEVAPISLAFVPETLSNGDLEQRGFDSVLDLTMDSISSRPSENGLHVHFTTINQARLTSLRTGQVLATRIYNRDLPARAVFQLGEQRR